MMPLDDLAIIELAGLGPVPFAGMILAGLGADVIRVDRPGGPPIPDPMAGAVGRGKRSVALDLKKPEGVDILLELVAGTDILLEGFRPGVADRLGIGPDVCMDANPDVIYGRMTGWGAEGPYASMAGHDINYIGLSGALHAIGASDHPSPPLNLVGDNGGGAMYLVAGVLAAIHDRERSGGTIVEAAMIEGAASLMAPFYEMAAVGLWEDRREANLLDGDAPFYTTYRTSDDKWMAVGPLEPLFYAEMLSGLGLDQDDLPDQYDRDRWPELRSRLSGTFVERTRAEWEERFDGTDACVTPVLSLSEAPDHQHNVARQVFGGPEHHRLPNPTPRIGGDLPFALPDAPDIGADTGEILSLLGYEAASIETLRARGVIA
ncbi:MAG: CaiB/BaiF CoA-transferase family protein [Actinomycetota bacterium]|nr:CaiB/BaiF CoA-transferase family protein [Actinomycetota bacterium]